VTPEPTRMYDQGPIRLFSTERFLGGVPYHGGQFTGYVGLFVCAECRLEVPRVLFVMTLGDWACRDCSSAWKRAAASLGASQG
jgi:hypothetical protein